VFLTLEASTINPLGRIKVVLTMLEFPRVSLSPSDPASDASSSKAEEGTTSTTTVVNLVPKKSNRTSIKILSESSDSTQIQGIRKLVKQATKSPLPWYLQWQDNILDFLDRTIFKDLNKELSIFKKLSIWRKTSQEGMFIDLTIIFGSVLLSLNYIAETYDSSFRAQAYYRRSELLFVAWFTFDLALTIITAQSLIALLSIWTVYIDILTVIPIYAEFSMHYFTGDLSDVTRTLKLLRFLRVFSLFRLVKSVKKHWNLTEVNIQIVKIVLTSLCIVLIFAGLHEIMENSVKTTWFYDCKFSTASTNWNPSCTSSAPGFFKL